MTEGGNRVTQTDYLPDGKVSAIRRAVGTAQEQAYASYFYTDNGLPLSVKDANGNLTRYQYDGHDRQSKTYFPSKTTPGAYSTTDYEQYGYDNNGNLKTLRKRSGDTITFDYDNLNRLTASSYPVPYTADNATFGYDLLGRRTSANYAGHNVWYVWDNAGRLLATTAGGKTLSHRYDDAGNRTRTEWPDGFFVTRSYDVLNRLAGILENGAAILADYSNAYDDLSRRTTVTYGNCNAQSVCTTRAYTYNPQSALQTLAIQLSNTSNTWTYARNQANGVTHQDWSNSNYQWTGYRNGSTSYTPDGLNQYGSVGGSSLAYDPNGNLTGDGVWAYGYDLDNRLKSANSATAAASLSYDAEGRLRQTVISGATTNLLYDGTDLAAEYDSAGTLLRRYVHGPGVDEPLVWYEGAGTGNKSWLYADHQGSIVAVANSNSTSTSAYRYGPYGEPDKTTGVRFRYTGQQLLGALNLYYYKARFYSPNLGRFL